MSKNTQPRKHQSTEFKNEALLLSRKISATKTAEQLGRHTSQIYQWRSAADKKVSTNERGGTLATENGRLKREKAELEKLEIKGS